MSNHTLNSMRRLAKLIPRLTIVGLLFTAPAQAQAGKAPKPRQVSLTTSDGVELNAWYLASERGKAAAAVILLHDWAGSSNDLSKLARDLQSLGHAVLVPDLRGHGESTKLRDERTLEFAKMPVSQGRAMVHDVEACKQFLVKENNEERLNIDRLCVVGAGLGAAVAANWSIVDWSWPRLAGYRQGRDVKGLVWLSPPRVEKSVPLYAVTGHPVIGKELGVYIVVGANGKEAQDAEAIHKRLKALRGGTGEEKRLFYHAFETTAQGVELSTREELRIAERIDAFIKVAMAEKGLPWNERKNPLD